MAHYETYKIKSLILSFILNVSILYETALGLAVTDISQYVTSWLLTGQMVSFLDFTLQTLIFPYCYHGNKWRIKAAGNKKPLLHNGIWSFLHRDKQAFTTGLCCSIQYHCKSLRVGTALACASVQLTANCLRRGLRLDLKQWGCAAIQHQLYHMLLKRMCLSHQAVL